MARNHNIRNAIKRSEVHRKTKREKSQAKLQRRLENKKVEKGENGEQLRAERLAKNVPRTLENTRIYDSSSYLTANPAALRAAQDKAAAASRKVNAASPGSNEDSEVDDDDDEDDDDESMDDEEGVEEIEEVMPEAGPSRLPASSKTATSMPGAGDGEEPDATAEAIDEDAPQQPINTANQPPPRILITTSPKPVKDTYTFCEDLKLVFPGGEFFKRPGAKGFEIGRIARWAAKRGYNALLVVNEDHKIPNGMTVINLPAGPTAYFKLSSIRLGRTISGHARASPHSPELILNNFSTLLGHSIGRLFGSLFPPVPQFRGRQVVTLHNQRDFLFFRRHRYVFTSANSAKLQEIGPRFTLKLRWLRKGLPQVVAADGRISKGENADYTRAEQESDDEEEEEAAMRDIGKEQKKPSMAQMGIPALDDEQEFEWKWKPKMEVSRRTFFL